MSTRMAETTEGGELCRRMAGHMDAITWDRHGEMALANMRRNLGVLDRGKSIAALRDDPPGEGDSAIVIAAGPSIRRHDPIKAIKDSGYKGLIVATESSIAYCLRNGVVPHLTVTLDPHATRIVRWFGDPDLEKRSTEDDYFRRQDMDESFARERETNRELLGLLDRHGKDIRVALATSASAAVVDRVLQTGMPVYWWNPMLDDPDDPASKTREIARQNRMPCMNAGGNVGSAAWMMAQAVAGKKRVAMVGMDFGYYADTPYTQTQYYHEAVALVGEANLDQIFLKIFNPHLGTWFYTDPAYWWYRQCFLEMAADADCRTYNCTEGGILFGDPIRFTPLAEFLSEVA